MKKVAAPTIDNIRNYNLNPLTVDEETTKLLDYMFNNLITNIKYDVKDREEDYYFEFYYHTTRGTIEDYESFEDCVDYYGISTFEEYKNLWNKEYPDEDYWYYFEFRKVVYDNEKYYLASINNRIILNVDPLNATGWRENRTSLVNVLCEVVEDFIKFARIEDYNEYVEKNLDYELREGLLLLKDYWVIKPEDKKEYFDKLSNININDFIQRANKQSVDNLCLMENMTANKYYEICKIAYNAISKGNDNISAKELFYKNADGRDQGLRNINGDSIEEFENWYVENCYHFDHAFEILPGRSFYRGDLWIDNDGNGYYLRLSGNNFWTSLDVIKIYVELIKNNIPVILHDAELITQRLLGESFMAIIPKGKITYGYQHILNKHLIDSMHLPKENRELFIKKIIWEEIPRLEFK